MDSFYKCKVRQKTTKGQFHSKRKSSMKGRLQLLAKLLFLVTVKGDTCVTDISVHTDDIWAEAESWCSMKCSSDEECKAYDYANGKCTIRRFMNIGSVIMSNQAVQERIKFKSLFSGTHTAKGGQHSMKTMLLIDIWLLQMWRFTNLLLGTRPLKIKLMPWTSITQWFFTKGQMKKQPNFTNKYVMPTKCRPIKLNEGAWTWVESFPTFTPMMTLKIFVTSWTLNSMRC